MGNYDVFYIVFFCRCLNKSKCFLVGNMPCGEDHIVFGNDVQNLVGSFRQLPVFIQNADRRRADAFLLHGQHDASPEG